MRVAGTAAIGLTHLSRLTAVVTDLESISHTGASACIARLAGETSRAAGTRETVDLEPTVVRHPATT